MTLEKSLTSPKENFPLSSSLKDSDAIYNRKRKEKKGFCPAAVITRQIMYSDLKDENVLEPNTPQLKKKTPDCD